MNKIEYNRQDDFVSNWIERNDRNEVVGYVASDEYYDTSFRVYLDESRIGAGHRNQKVRNLRGAGLHPGGEGSGLAVALLRDVSSN